MFAQPTPSFGVPNFAAQLTETTYSLGPGDGLQVTFYDVPEISGARTVLPDGTLSLPLIGSIAAEGLTAEQLSQRLVELYRPYLARPRVDVTVERPRPITLVVSGEVNRPGPYTFQPVQSVTFSGGTSPATLYNRITVSTALIQAAGLTERANVRQVTLVRRLPGGATVRRNLDLWALLQNGDVSQNPNLQDGDAILVPRSEEGKPDYDYDVVAQSSLSPEQIEVQVIGEVAKPGSVKIRSGAPLTSALIGAGGLTNLSDPTQVELVRANRDGTVTRRVVNARLEQPTDIKLNPPLRQSDMIVVRRSFGGDVINGVSTVLGPFTQLANVVVLFRALR
ncbi:polysaccharide biosynthesis/export family protein [Gloeobacter violaceus]|uniref:polysaccharide biosynthesis/export family protein n=1 Tax=Gloeobacter violaceus TaxID=33072 RepID=UPI0013E8C61F|nr:polysaccharide biosynthesis/export family protein [Gloeobacter violaceus]